VKRFSLDKGNAEADTLTEVAGSKAEPILQGSIFSAGVLERGEHTM